jgi:hypothetical protein
VPFYFLYYQLFEANYKLETEVDKEWKDSTAAIIYSNEARTIMSMLAISSCCRMM